MSMIELITTGDGSHSLLNTALDETYHSRHGALQESDYVFIKQGLDFFVTKTGTKQLSILEVGFGTGLNAWLTLQYAQQHKVNIGYTSLETYPLAESVWPLLNYAKGSEFENYFSELHKAAWNEEVVITPAFRLKKVEQSLQNFRHDGPPFDLVYFDAFAPNKQPELWEAALIRKVAEALNTNGVFVTYCAKGQLKRDLKSFDMIVESLSGPPGKREMVRALKK